MKKAEELKMFLENLTKLEKSLWKEIVAWEGVDKDMQNFVAQDRNDVIEAKYRFNRGHIGSLRSFVDSLDTYIRDGVVTAFAADLGNDWVRENLGYEIN